METQEESLTVAEQAGKEVETPETDPFYVPIFVSSLQDFLSYVAKNKNTEITPETAVSMRELVRNSRTHPLQGDLGGEITEEQIIGLAIVRSWIANGATDRSYLQAVKKTKWVDYMSIMARRHLFTNRMGEIFTYSATIAEFFDASSFEEAKVVQEEDPFVVEVERQYREWGFSDVEEVFALGTGFMRYISAEDFEPRLSVIMSRVPSSNGNREAETLKALFSFFYINHLFPPGQRDDLNRETRSVALFRLGLPELQYFDVLDFDNRHLINMCHIAAYLLHMNSSFIRYGYGKGMLQM